MGSGERGALYPLDTTPVNFDSPNYEFRSAKPPKKCP
jgi:hypothetical protein